MDSLFAPCSERKWGLILFKGLKHSNSSWDNRSTFRLQTAINKMDSNSFRSSQRIAERERIKIIGESLHYQIAIIWDQKYGANGSAESECTVILIEDIGFKQNAVTLIHRQFVPSHPQRLTLPDFSRSDSDPLLSVHRFTDCHSARS